MTDYSALIPWMVVFFGFVASMGIGWIRRGPRTFGKVIAAAGLAVALGLVLTCVSVLFNSLCIGSWHLCIYRGDGNMAYWFHSFFAIPIFWLLTLAFGTREEVFIMTRSTFDHAVDGALAQFRRQETIHQRCPHCKSLISLEPVAPEAAPAKRKIRLRCACSKCDRLFELLGEKA